MLSQYAKLALEIFAKGFGRRYHRPIEYDIAKAAFRSNGPWRSLKTWAFLNFIWMPVLSQIPSFLLLVKGKFSLSIMTQIELISSFAASLFCNMILFLEIYFYRYKDVIVISFGALMKLEKQLGSGKLYG